jgi:hypothetical protein
MKYSVLWVIQISVNCIRFNSLGCPSVALRLSGSWLIFITNVMSLDYLFIKDSLHKCMVLNFRY